MSHHHSHHHSQSLKYGKIFLVSISLNIIYVVIEMSIGIVISSFGLIADAGHNFSDVIGLVIAWAGVYFAQLASSRKFTYGFKRAPIIGSLVNALLLFSAMGIVAWEAIKRFWHPALLPGKTIIAVTIVGLIVNFGTALLFIKNQHDINMRGAFLHMFADGLVTLGVLLSGVIILFFDVPWLDPVISLIIVVVILWGTWGLFRDSMKLSLDAVPSHIDMQKVIDVLYNMPKIKNRIKNVHHVHIWSIGASEAALTAHLVVGENEKGVSFIIKSANEYLKKTFGIVHTTLQVENENYAKSCNKLNKCECN